MNKKIILLCIIIVIAGGIVAFALTRSPQTKFPEQTATSPESSDTRPAPAEPLPAYTAAQVAMHADASSCWTIIRGDVYDLTSWADKHPGGREAILSLCGKNGTAAFEGQHGGMAQQEQVLATFRIGSYTE